MQMTGSCATLACSTRPYLERLSGWGLAVAAALPAQADSIAVVPGRSKIGHPPLAPAPRAMVAAGGGRVEWWLRLLVLVEAAHALAPAQTPHIHISDSMVVEQMHVPPPLRLPPPHTHPLTWGISKQHGLLPVQLQPSGPTPHLPCTKSSGGRGVAAAPGAAGRCSSSRDMPSGSTSRVSRTKLWAGRWGRGRGVGEEGAAQGWWQAAGQRPRGGVQGTQAREQQHRALQDCK